MPIILNHNCIFVHIPKTGGQTILTSFGIEQSPLYWNKDILFGIFDGEEPTHYTCSEIKKVTDLYNSLFKFAIVRNPYSRLVSEYQFSCLNIQNKKTFWLSRSTKTFNSWVRLLHDYMQSPDYLKNEHYKRSHSVSQYDFLYIDGVLQVDKVLKFENFPDIEEFMLNKFGVSLCGIVNQSVTKKYNNWVEYYLNNGWAGNITLKRINELYKKDFETFGYKMYESVKEMREQENLQ